MTLKMESYPDPTFEDENGNITYDDSPAWWMWTSEDDRWHWESDGDHARVDENNILPGYGAITEFGLIDRIGVTVWGTAAEAVEKRNMLLDAARKAGKPS